ncbi:MAG: hypothetical protein EOO45_16020 [Flavobacterium sp.]|nr:MAG: hypothetical protein EOO45_16020 [Flavobacterium sp.]
MKDLLAHYIARHQENISEKLKWDEVALEHSLKITDNDDVNSSMPSLYLNIANAMKHSKT